MGRGRGEVQVLREQAPFRGATYSNLEEGRDEEDDQEGGRKGAGEEDGCKKDGCKKDGGEEDHRKKDDCQEGGQARGEEEDRENNVLQGRGSDHKVAAAIPDQGGRRPSLFLL
jgi:hypothetical protein